VVSLALAASFALAAGPAEPTLSLPPWPLWPDGELVAAPPGALLTADQAQVEPVVPGLWRIRPEPGARSVTVRAAGREAVAQVEPPTGSVELSVRPAAPVKGRDVRVAVELQVRSAAGQPDPSAAAPRLVASSGRVGVVEPIGPGRFRTTYLLPEARWPEVVALFAVVPRCPSCATPAALGSLRLPLASAIELPGETEPGVSTTLEVGGALHGPVRADAAGRFRIPVVVPPGAAHGVSRSVSGLGNERRTLIDLGLPPAPRIACAAHPSRLPADGQARAGIFCLAHQATGAPEEGGAIELSVPRGRLVRQRWERGLWRAEYQAPRGGQGLVEVVARRREVASGGTAAVLVELAPGAPAHIDWKVAGEPLLPGESALAEAVAVDARGDRLGPAQGDGPHASEVAVGRFVARAELGHGLDPVDLAFALQPVAPDEAATLALRRDGEAWVAEARSVDGRPAKWVELTFGGGVRGQTDALGDARVPVTGPSEWVTAPGGLRAAGWAWASPPAQPIAVKRRAAVALRPPGQGDVTATVEGRWVTWTVRGPTGGPDPSRPVQLRSRSVTLGTPEAVGQGGRAEVLGGSGLVAVVDVQSGAAALVEVE